MLRYEKGENWDGRQNKEKSNRAWTMYDWGNSAFATTIMAAVLPVYIPRWPAQRWRRTSPTARWGFTTSFSALLVAVLAPILGSVADFKGNKKNSWVFHGDWSDRHGFPVFRKNRRLAARIDLIYLRNMGFSGSLVFTTHCCRMWPLKMKSTRFHPKVLPWGISAVVCCWPSMWS